MLLGGLWHGADWNFVVWGMLHGFYLMAERFLKKRVHITLNYWAGMLMALLTFTGVNITWVFFRARTFSKAYEMLKSMFFLNPDGEKILQYEDIIKVLTVMALVFLVHWFMRDTSVRQVAEKTPKWVLAVGWAFMFVILAIAQGSSEQFIYFQF